MATFNSFGYCLCRWGLLSGYDTTSFWPNFSIQMSTYWAKVCCQAGTGLFMEPILWNQWCPNFLFFAEKVSQWEKSCWSLASNDYRSLEQPFSTGGIWPRLETDLVMIFLGLYRSEPGMLLHKLMHMTASTAVSHLVCTSEGSRVRIYTFSDPAQDILFLMLQVLLETRSLLTLHIIL